MVENGEIKNFTEFYNVLKSKQIPGYNIVYADKNDTIFYISNGLIPKRTKGFDWKEAVPGNTSKTLWEETYDIDELPQSYNLHQDMFIMLTIVHFYPLTSKIILKKMFSDEMNFETYDNKDLKG